MLNVKSGQNNAAFLIALEPSLFHINPKTGSLESDLLLRIAFKQITTGRIYQSKLELLRSNPEMMVQGDPFFYQFKYDVFPGNYEVVVEVEDYISKKTHLESILFESRNMQAPISISDPVLLQDFGGVIATRPLLGTHITSAPDRLGMSINVYSSQKGFFRARAVLYRKQTNNFSGPTDNEHNGSSEFVTVNQFSTVVDARSGIGVLSHVLDFNEMPHGEYLVEVYIYQQDSLVAEANRSFIIDWKNLGRVFGDIAASIEMLRWVATTTTIQSLLNLKDADEQQQKFLEFWESRANLSQETAMDAIERYYSRVFYALENFNEGIPGWQTDRGKTMILYGQPDNQSSVKFKNLLFETWTYSKWGIRFLFRNDEGRMRNISLG